MKRRVIKKWIKRYLDTAVEHLPTITQWNWDTDTNITLINGERKVEGNTFEVDYNAKSAIRKQLKGIQSVLQEYEGRKIYVRQQNEPKIYLNQHWHLDDEHHRKNPKMKFYGIRMRFIIEKVTHGIERGV